jgi:hypothetical protein
LAGLALVGLASGAFLAVLSSLLLTASSRS